MRTRLFSTFAFVAMICALAPLEEGCKDPKTQADVNTFVGDIVQEGCVLAADAAGVQEPAILVQVCDIAPGVTPAVLSWIEHVFAAKKAAVDPAVVAKMQSKLGAYKAAHPK